MSRYEHFRGALLGLAVCDALGTTLEFKSPGSFKPIDDIVGGGPFGLKPGQWTDDTSMALCLAESLVEKQGFDPVDQLERYVSWYRHGHFSCTGRCFDIGTTTWTALETFIATRNPYSGSTSSHAAGNGSIMRLAPVPMFFASQPIEAIEKSGESSRTTHGATTCIDACRYFGGLIAGAINGATKDELLSDHGAPTPRYWREFPLCPEIDEIAAGSFIRRNPPEIKGTGHVVRSLEAALWAFHRGHDFKEGALLAVNLGDDADTTGAVYGQIAGAFYGYDAIPESWRAKVADKELILALADRLIQR
jgi:ADP-ribosylglycohydrolase